MKARNFPSPAAYYLLPPLFILAVLLYGYSETFNFPFQFDDQSAIQENPDIRDLSDLATIWSRNPARFFTFFSIAVNYHFGGLDVFGYHVFNFATHLFSSLAVFWLMSLLLSTGAGRESLGEEAGAPLSWRGFLFCLSVAAAFAAHPLQTEAVTYIWQRNTSLCALFYLLSMTLYLKSAILMDRHGEDRSRAVNQLFAGAIFFAVAAMFTKQNAVTLPVAIVMMDYFFVSGSLARMRAKAGRVGAALVTILIIPMLTALGMSQEVKHIGARFAYMLSPYEYLLTQFKVIVTVYLKLVFYPAGQVLDYDFKGAGSFSESFPYFVVLLAMLVFAFWIFKRNRIVSYGILFFFLTLSVEASFFPLEDLVFEHRMYLPLAGLFMAIFATVFNLAARLVPGRPLQATAALAAVAVIAMAVVTRDRNEAWRTEESLWKDVVEKAPGKSRGYNNLGVIFFARNELDEAEKWFRQAMVINPDSNFALYYLGLIYKKRGDLDKALEFMEKALDINPAATAAHYAIGNIYMDRKEFPKAVKHYKIALKLENGMNIEGLMGLGTALTYSGRINEAIKVYQKVVKLDPSNPTALGNLGALYRHKGDKEKADIYFRKAGKKI